MGACRSDTQLPLQRQLDLHDVGGQSASSMFVTSLSKARPQGREVSAPAQRTGEGGKFNRPPVAQGEHGGRPRPARGKKEAQWGGKSDAKPLSREEAAEQAAQAHPSWAAARAARDQPTIARFEGKKVKFDSDSE